MAEKAYCDLVFSGVVTEDELMAAAKNYATYIKKSRNKMYLPNNFLEKFVFKDYLGQEQQKEAEEVEEKIEKKKGQEEEFVGENEEWWKYEPNAWKE